MKRIVSWLLYLVLTVAFFTGCGMFGDTRLYTGLYALCAKCHLDNPAAPPAGMEKLKQSTPGAEGIGGSTGKCTFQMDHWSRVETKGVKRD
jgi:hypothetical protein